MTDDPELTYLACIVDMCSNAGTGVIIPNTDYPQGLRGIFRQFAKIDDVSSLLTRHEIYSHIKMLRNHLVDLGFIAVTCSAVGSASRM